MTTKSLPMNFLRVLTFVGDSTIKRDLFLAPLVDLVLDLILAFSSFLTLGLTFVLATTSPKTLSLLIILMSYPAIELKYPQDPLNATYSKTPIIFIEE